MMIFFSQWIINKLSLSLKTLNAVLILDSQPKNFLSFFHYFITNFHLYFDCLMIWLERKFHADNILTLCLLIELFKILVFRTILKINLSLMMLRFWYKICARWMNEIFYDWKFFFLSLEHDGTRERNPWHGETSCCHSFLSDVLNYLNGFLKDF